MATSVCLLRALLQATLHADVASTAAIGSAVHCSLTLAHKVLCI
jgi:hypothetical protein